MKKYIITVEAISPVWYEYVDAENEKSAKDKANLRIESGFEITKIEEVF